MEGITYQIFRELQETTKERPMDRYEVAKRYGISQDRVRKEIQRLRRMGVPICADSSDTSKRGYWIATNMDEYNRFAAEYTHRSKEIMNTAEAMSENVILWIMGREEQVKGIENALL